MPFVAQSACPNPAEDLLPGLAALTQRWLADVGLSKFRDTAGQPVDLNAWFSAPRVSRHIKARCCFTTLLPFQLSQGC